LDIRFDDEPKKGRSPTTRLHLPNQAEEDGDTSRPGKSGRRGRTASGGAEEPQVRVEKPELNPLARIGLILCGFIFSGMVLFTLTGYERITRAHADINSLNTEIETTKLRINELDVQIECAVTIQDAQAVAEAYGMQYPEQSQYVKIGDALPFSGSAPLTDTQTDGDTQPEQGTGDTQDTTQTPGTGDTGDSTDGGG
jgi:hypothetical protein